MNEFNPIDKVTELSEMFSEYNPIIHKNTEEGYDYSVSMELQNPTGGEVIYIDCDSNEFTVCFSQYYHTHYYPDEGMYDLMCSIIFDLLNSKRGVAAIFCGSDNKWIGSTMIEIDEASLPIEEIFYFVFNKEKSAEELRTNGGEARLIFRDSSLNKIIKIC